MPSILPVSDLRNYNEVLKNCQVGEPVFLTKNGRGRFVVLDIEDYERERAEKRRGGARTDSANGGAYVKNPYEDVDSEEDA